MSPIVRSKMPEVDTLRGVAIALVVLYHGLFWSLPQTGVSPLARAIGQCFRGGWCGVNLFFVLSGFLITGNLLDSRDMPRRFVRFYWRRALRILPAFLLTLAAVALAGLVTWQFAALSLAFLANIAPLAGVAVGYPVLWSLAVEEHFYAVWPALVYNVRVRTLVAISAALVVGEPLLRMTMASRGALEGLSSYTWYSVDGLAAGALLAVLARRARRSTFAFTAAGLLVFAGASATALLVTHTSSRTTVAGAALTPTVLYALFGGILAVTLLAGSSSYQRLVNIAPLQWLGYVSYGLYLVHLLCFALFDRLVQHGPAVSTAFVLTRFAVAGSASIVLAAASRYTVEEWFLSLKSRVAPVVDPPLAAPAVAGIFAASDG